MISEDNTLVIGDIHGGRGGGTPILSGMQETDKVSGNKEGEGNTVGISRKQRLLIRMRKGKQSRRKPQQRNRKRKRRKRIYTGRKYFLMVKGRRTPGTHHLRPMKKNGKKRRNIMLPDRVRKTSVRRRSLQRKRPNRLRR